MTRRLFGCINSPSLGQEDEAERQVTGYSRYQYFTKFKVNWRSDFQFVVDQSNFILMGSIIYSVLAGIIFDQIHYVYEYTLSTKYICVLFKQTFIPVYWIYSSEKLQVVMWKYIRQSIRKLDSILNLHWFVTILLIFILLHIKIVKCTEILMKYSFYAPINCFSKEL